DIARAHDLRPAGLGRFPAGDRPQTGQRPQRRGGAGHDDDLAVLGRDDLADRGHEVLASRGQRGGPVEGGVHEQSRALDDGDELRLPLVLVQTQILHVQAHDPHGAEVVEDDGGGRFVVDVDVDLAIVDHDGSPVQPVEFGGESVRGGGRQYGDDLELLGPGFVDDLRGAGDLGEHRLLRGAAGDGDVEEVEEFDDPGRSGVDDLGLAQRGELTGGLAQGRPRSFAHGGDDFEQVRSGFGAFPGLAGHGVEDREHGPVDGAGNGGPSPVRGGLEGGGHGIGGG